MILDKSEWINLSNNKFVVGQTRLFGFAQNDLSNIDEASIWGLFLCLDPVFKCKLHFKIAL